MLSGSGTDDLYVPSLWYYKDLEFLQDQMEGESGISTIIEQEESSSSQSLNSTPSQPLASTNPGQSKRKKSEDLQRDLLTLARDHFKKPENEYQAMARNWAFKLERMSAEQRRLAEKFINEILFE
ncbi:jg25629, partial [Pararge aegeria aegeria]